MSASTSCSSLSLAVRARVLAEYLQTGRAVAWLHDTNRGSVMSMRGPDRNAERNRGGHIGPDGPRAPERELLKVTRAGEPLTAQQDVTLLERLAKLRYGLAQTHAEHVAASPSAALIKAYDELYSALVLLLHERDDVDVDAHMAHARAEADQRMDAAQRRARADVQRLITAA